AAVFSVLRPRTGDWLAAWSAGMAFVSIRARPAFGRGGWMKGEQGFGDSITASIDCPATAGRSRQAQLKCVAQGAKHSHGQCKSRDVFRLPNIDTQPSCLALRNTNKCLR